MASQAGLPPQDYRLANAKPQFLIGWDKDQQLFYFQKEALEYLCNEQASQSGLITVFGEPRSGSSELVAGLLGKKERKCSDHPGVYMWDIPLKSVDKQGQACDLYIAEVVGLTSFSEDAKQKLLLMLFLMSSSLVYCSQGDLGEHSFEAMSSLTTGLARVDVYDLNQHVNDLYISSISPPLLWCLTGRKAPLTDNKGASVSACTYLEQSLTQLSLSAQTPLISSVLKFMNVFSNRCCLEVSAFKDKESVSIPKTKSSCLPTLLIQAAEGRSGFANRARLSNSSLVSLVPSLVDACNGSGSISLWSIITATSSFDVREKLAKSKLEYSSSLQDSFGGVQFDPTNEHVESLLQQLRTKAFSCLDETSPLGEQGLETDELVKAYMDLDEYIESRERAVRKKQEELKISLAKNFLQNFEAGPGNKWRERVYSVSTFQNFQEDMKNQFEAMIMADLTPEVNSGWMERLKTIYSEYMQKLRSELMETYNRHDIMLDEKAETKKQLLQKIQNEENAIKEAERQLARLAQMTDQELEIQSQCLQEVLQSQATIEQITNEEKIVVAKNKELVTEETAKKSTKESLKKELEHVMKNAG